MSEIKYSNLTFEKAAIGSEVRYRTNENKSRIYLKKCFKDYQQHLHKQKQVIHQWKLFNEIKLIAYSLCRANKITKTAYDNIMNSV